MLGGVGWLRKAGGSSGLIARKIIEQLEKEVCLVDRRCSRSMRSLL